MLQSSKNDGLRSFAAICSLQNRLGSFLCSYDVVVACIQIASEMIPFLGS